MTIKNGKYENSAQWFLLGTFTAEDEALLLLASWSLCPFHREQNQLSGESQLEFSKGKCQLPVGRAAWLMRPLV